MAGGSLLVITEQQMLNGTVGGRRGGDVKEMLWVVDESTSTLEKIKCSRADSFQTHNRSTV